MVENEEQGSDPLCIAWRTQVGVLLRLLVLSKGVSK